MSSTFLIEQKEISQLTLKGMRLNKKDTLLYISAHFPPCSAVGIYRTLGFVRHLKEIGWDITVLAIKDMPYEPKDIDLLQRIPSGIKVIRTIYFDIFSLWSRMKHIARQECSEQITKAHALNDPVENDSNSKKFKEQLSSFLQTPDRYTGWIPYALPTALVKAKRPSVIVATAPPFSALILGVCLKVLWRVPLVIDLRDPWRGNAFRPKRPGWVDRWDRYLEKLVFSKAELIIANTKAAARLYASRYPHCRSKVNTITNGYDETFEDVSPIRENPTIALSIVHVGSLYGNRHIRPLVNVIDKIFKGVKPPLKIDLFGSLSDEQKSFLNDSKNDILRFHGSIPHQEAIARLKGADVVLVVGNCVPGSVQIPGKIFELLPLKKPLWLIDELPSPTFELLNEIGLNFFFSQNREADMEKELRNILQLWSEKKLLEINKTIKDKKIRYFSRRNLALNLNGLLSNVLKEPGN